MWDLGRCLVSLCRSLVTLELREYGVRHWEEEPSLGRGD